MTEVIDALTLEEYFKEHPEEEQEFFEEMERLRMENDPIYDYPDHEFQQGASYAI